MCPTGLSEKDCQVKPENLKKEGVPLSAAEGFGGLRKEFGLRSVRSLHSQPLGVGHLA